MATAILLIIPLLAGYLLDLLLGDPPGWPHPIRLFGLLIARGERLLNNGKHRLLKGFVLTLTLCIGSCAGLYCVMRVLREASLPLWVAVSSLLVFYGLANRQLVREGLAVIRALDEEGLEAGRRQLSFIVGRDTSVLGPGQIRIAVLETLSENLCDGVIAPLFYFAIAGLPGMYMYKMINTLDSMIGYRNPRYEKFGKTAARLDDVANFIPARLTALLMILVAGGGRVRRRAWQFVLRYGHQHKSPNAGYPEAALAGIIDARFGGPNVYQGVRVEKPYIGINDRLVGDAEIRRAVYINHACCLVMVLSVTFFLWKFNFPCL